MNDAAILREGASVGKWIKSGKPDKTPPRVAFVGGMKYDQDAVDVYIDALYRKYPDATIVVGSARGAETYIAERTESLGFTVEQPAEEWWPDKALQVEAVLVGCTAVVIVGSQTAQRAARATQILKRVDGGMRNPRPVVRIAEPPKTERAPKRPSRGSFVRA